MFFSDSEKTHNQEVIIKEIKLWKKNTLSRKKKKKKKWFDYSGKQKAQLIF